MIWSTGPNLGDTREVRASSVPVLREFQRRAVAFDSLFCRTSSSVALTIGTDTAPARAEPVSGNYFEALRVGPAAGRVFSTAADDTSTAGTGRGLESSLLVRIASAGGPTSSAPKCW